MTNKHSPGRKPTGVARVVFAAHFDQEYIARVEKIAVETSTSKASVVRTHALLGEKIQNEIIKGENHE